jgi:uncharacterized repeat protein (TIGR03803 family)
MIQGTDGNSYGTTYQGGANNQGVVFKMTAGGTLTVLHSFSAATDGENPKDAMVHATDSNFYGVANRNTGGTASLHKVTLKGVFSTLYLFDGTIGSGPVCAGAEYRWISVWRYNLRHTALVNPTEFSIAGI